MTVLWLCWLGVVALLTWRDFAAEVHFFYTPGSRLYVVYVTALAAVPLLLLAHQRLRRNSLWRYELAAIAAIPLALSLSYAPRATFVVAWIFCACFAGGRWVCGKLSLHPAGLIDDIAVSAGLGVGILQTILFAIGLAGFFREWLLALLLGLPLLLFWRDVRDLLRILRGCQARWNELTDAASPLSGAAIFFAAALAACAGAYMLAPSIAYDSIWAHLPAAETYAQRGAVQPLPNQPYSYNPQGVETLMALAYSFGGQTAAQILPVLLFGLALLALYRITRQCGAGKMAALGGVILAGSAPVFHWTGSVAKNDSGEILFLMLSLACFLHGRDSRNFRWIQLSVFFLAMSTCVKNTALFAIPGAALLYLHAAWQQPRRIRACVSLLGIFVVFGLVWQIRDAALTGNPLAPYAINQATQGEETSAASVAAKYSFIPWNMQFHGDIYMLESRLQEPLGILLLCFLPLWGVRRRIDGAIAVFTGAFLLLWGWSNTVMSLRYVAMPLLVLMALTGSLVFQYYGAATRALRASYVAALSYGLLFAFCGVMTFEINVPQMMLLAHRIDERQYLTETLDVYRSLQFLKAAAHPGDWAYVVGQCPSLYAPDPERLICGQPDAHQIQWDLRQRNPQFILLRTGPLEQEVMGHAAALYRDPFFAVYRGATP